MQRTSNTQKSEDQYKQRQEKNDNKINKQDKDHQYQLDDTTNSEDFFGDRINGNVVFLICGITTKRSS